MENRVFVYTRLNGKETAITGGSFGTSYQMHTYKTKDEEVKDAVVSPLAIVEDRQQESYEEQQQEQSHYTDDYFEELFKKKAHEEHIKQVMSKRNIRKLELKVTEREVKEVADKYINPILLKHFGLKVNHKAIAKELVNIRRRFK